MAHAIKDKAIQGYFYQVNDFEGVKLNLRASFEKQNNRLRMEVLGPLLLFTSCTCLYTSHLTIAKAPCSTVKVSIKTNTVVVEDCAEVII